MSLSLLPVVVVLALGGICQANNGTIHRLDKVAERGTVCLDGSPPAYYLRPGFSTGVDKWIIHLKGGGSCLDLEECYERAKTDRGSSSPEFWPNTLEFNGLLSDNETVNTDFYNWNLVYVIYCDGASFSNFLAEPQIYNDTKVYFKGRAILKAVFDVLLEDEGVNNASEVLLTGSSAGASATYVNVDRVRGWIPKNIPMKAMADAGYFPDVKTVNGTYLDRDEVRLAMAFHNITAEGLNEVCANKYSGDELWKCWIPPYFYDFIKTPIFVLNSETDKVQLGSLYGLTCYPPRKCTEEQTKQFYTFREEWLNQALPVLKSLNNGLFAHSCITHTLMLYDDPWSTIAVGGKTLRDAFSDWYFSNSGEAQLKRVDCPYPCNTSCFSIVVKDEE